MRLTTEERRRHARLPLQYTIRVRREEGSPGGRPHMLTSDVSASGAYFCTFDDRRFDIGSLLDLAIEVPHRRGWDGRDAQLKLRGKARVVRVVGPDTHGRFGENGETLTGIAVEFAEPLELNYRWL